MELSYKAAVKTSRNVTRLSRRRDSIIEQLELDADLSGVNAGYVEALYEEYLRDPDSVPDGWVRRFSSLQGETADLSHRAIRRRMAQPPSRKETKKTYKIGGVEYPSRTLYLIHAYRVHGYTHADLDPLKLHPPRQIPELDLNYYGLSEADLDREFPTWDLVAPTQLPLREILEILRKTYSSRVGLEFMHIADSAQKHWLQARLETIQSTPNYGEDTRRHIYNRTMRAEQFERFLHTRYTGQKRFSIEGGESLIPLLDALIQKSGEIGAKEINLGMAHRGRLNVLANILGKSVSDIFAEFEGRQFEDVTFGSGDVKYHLGFSSDIHTAGGVLHLSLAFNPSHLEIISPVVEGSVRARQRRRRDDGRDQVMSVIVHGDAAFAGQGVVAESINLSKLSGFKTGGTIHIVVNNQIGFTTNPYDARSTLYSTDVAKMVQAPILHVNGDDPEAVSLAAIVAVEFRYHFKQDVVLDLICYRRHGHNEADEPSVTQPVMYRRISEHPTVHELYRKRLIRDGLLTKEESEAMVREYRSCLEKVRRDKDRPPPAPIDSLHGRWEGYIKQDAPEPETSVGAEQLASLAQKAHAIPAGFVLHEKIRKIYDARLRMMAGKTPIDWGCAETMAYATLLNQGGWVRISGQDTGRGTFFHRHAVVYDQNSGKKFVPLRQTERGDLAHFVVVDSMLSELAVMAFEYGYSLAEPRALVIWEAQYGDFANNAQVVVDQFISSSESKWRRMSGLVLWLPHGYEGQGAEHSSARLERYLQLCAEDNMQVVYPSTPAQLFHLLRRQLLIKMRKPLIMMGPKSLLRQRLSFSSLDDLTGGSFRTLIPEIDPLQTSGCRRLILCSGKVYYDLLAERRKRALDDIGIVRIEQLYPFPSDLFKQQAMSYQAANQILWVQEEPENQGAWLEINSSIRRCLLPNQRILLVAREASAAPAVGSLKRHQERQRSLIEAALSQDIETNILV